MGAPHGDDPDAFSWWRDFQADLEAYTTGRNVLMFLDANAQTNLEQGETAGAYGGNKTTELGRAMVDVMRATGFALPTTFAEYMRHDAANETYFPKEQLTEGCSIC